MSTHVLLQPGRDDRPVRILLRTAVLAAIWLAGVLGATQLGDRDGGANIGVGLLMFALLLTAAGAWGAADSVRQPHQQVVITWVAVAAAMGLLVPVSTYVAESGSSWRVLVSDLIQVGPFIAALVAAPALLGGLLARSVSARRRGHGPR